MITLALGENLLYEETDSGQASFESLNRADLYGQTAFFRYIAKDRYYKDLRWTPGLLTLPGVSARRELVDPTD